MANWREGQGTSLIYPLQTMTIMVSEEEEDGKTPHNTHTCAHTQMPKASLI